MIRNEEMEKENKERDRKRIENKIIWIKKYIVKVSKKENIFTL